MLPLTRGSRSSHRVSKRLNPILPALTGLLSLYFCALGLSSPEALAATGRVVSTEHVSARLVSQYRTLPLGETSWIAVHLQMIPGWHTYWKNPGDSGIANSLKWTLPEGFSVSDIHWPVPERIDIPPLTNYGYHGNMYMLLRLSTPDDASLDGKFVDLKVHARWLVCEEVCIPEEGKLKLRAPIRRGLKVPDTRVSEQFDHYLSRLPKETPQDYFSFSSTEGDLLIQLQGKWGLQRGDDLEFFPAESGVIQHAAEQRITYQAGGLAQIRIPLAETLKEPPTTVAGVLVQRSGGQVIGHRLVGPVVALQLDWQLLLRALIFAFLGGLLLNLMPCVFPVLAIKVLGFIQHRGSGLRVVRTNALLYLAGVLACFLFLAALLVALQSAGQELGWGFQLQHPPFLVALTGLLVLMGLNLSGLFEFSGRWMGFGSKLAEGSGRTAAFFNGVLAVVVATPCTAPFMGTAMGIAFTLPPALILLVFLFLGLGMATPYVLFSWWPQLTRFMPKPGPWMQTFRELMAFPLYATAIWLLWVLDQQIGPDGLARILFALLLMTMGLWLLRWNQKRQSRLWVLLLALAVLLVALVFGVQGARLQAPGPVTTANTKGIQWSSFSTAGLNEHLEEGRPVFVNFTAAWCITCKVNERVVFEDESVATLFKERGIVALQGDWTSRDAEITRTLKAHGRVGVPLYLYYPAGQSKPRVLPQIFSVSEFKRQITAPEAN